MSQGVRKQIFLHQELNPWPLRGMQMTYRLGYKMLTTRQLITSQDPNTGHSKTGRLGTISLYHFIYNNNYMPRPFYI